MRLRAFVQVSPPVREQCAYLWLALALLLAFFLSRLIAIDRFPPFLDEMLHVRQAELSQQASPFTYTAEGRLFTLWWYMLFEPYRAAPVWLARTATLLAVLPGFAAVIGLGRLAVGSLGVLFAGLSYLFSTSNFFFERLALADPISASAILVAVYFAYRLSRRAHAGDAILTGLALFIAVAAKATALPFLGIPLAAAWALRPPGPPRRANLRWLAIALACSLGLVAVFALALRVRQYTPFGFIELYNSQATRPLLERTLSNITLFAQWFLTYTGVFVFILLLVALVGSIMRRKFYLVLCLLGPALTFWINDRQFTRYFAALTVIFLLIGALFLAHSVQKQRRSFQLVSLVFVFAWGMVQWLPFAWAGYTAPVQLALPPNDYAEYIAGDASGFGLLEIRDILRDQQPNEVIGILANCASLHYLALGQFDVNCPPLNPNGQEVENLRQLIANSRRAGVYVVLEPLPYAPDHIPGLLVDTVDRPGNRSSLSIYRLEP